MLTVQRNSFLHLIYESYTKGSAGSIQFFHSDKKNLFEIEFIPIFGLFSFLVMNLDCREVKMRLKFKLTQSCVGMC